MAGDDPHYPGYSCWREIHAKSCFACGPELYLCQGVTTLVTSFGTALIGSLLPNESCSKLGNAGIMQMISLSVDVVGIAFMAYSKTQCGTEPEQLYFTQQIGLHQRAVPIRCRFHAGMTMCAIGAAINLFTLIVLRVNCK